MIPRPLDGVSDKAVRENFDFIHAEAQGRPLSLDSVPSATIPLLNDNEEGLYLGVLYKRQGDTIYVFTPSSTITVI